MHEAFALREEVIEAEAAEQYRKKSEKHSSEEEQDRKYKVLIDEFAIVDTLMPGMTECMNEFEKKGERYTTRMLNNSENSFATLFWYSAYEIDKADKNKAAEAESRAALAASQEAEAQTQARAQEVAETTCPFMAFLTESVIRDASTQEMDTGSAEVLDREEKRARVGRKGEEKGKGSGGSSSSIPEAPAQAFSSIPILGLTPWNIEPSSSVNDAIKGKGNMGKGKAHE